jgi:Cu/Ag efflux protein CusF
MRGMSRGLTAVALVGSLVWVSGVAAQTQAPAPSQSAPAAPAAPAAMDKQSEGKIKNVDPSGKTLTLADGTTFMIPSGVSVAELKPGATVKVAYQEKGGQKILTHVEVVQ